MSANRRLLAGTGLLSNTINAVTSTVTDTLGSSTRLLVFQAMRGLAMQSKGAWPLKGESKGKQTMVVSAVDELLSRLTAKEEEERAMELLSRRANNLAPEEWPGPPDRISQPYAWLRARVLYSFCPADRDVGFALKRARWMLIVPLMMVAPVVSTPLWLLLILLVLISVDDPFQLLNAAWLFKLYALIIWGLLPIIESHLERYVLLTSTSGHSSCSGLTRHLMPAPLRGVADALEILELDTFYLCWILCYALFYKARRSLLTQQDEGHRAGTYVGVQGIYDPNVDFEIVTRLFRFDVAVFLLFTLIQRSYLVYVILGKSGVSYLVAWHTDLDQAHIGPYIFHRYYAANAVALIALPHLVFKLPIIGELLHHIHTTGYDQSGAVRLAMSHEDRQSKWRREQGIDAPLDAINSLPTTAVDVVDGVLAKAEEVGGAVVDVGHASWDVMRDGTVQTGHIGREIVGASVGAVGGVVAGSIGAVGNLVGAIAGGRDHPRTTTTTNDTRAVDRSSAGHGAEALV